MPYNQGEDNPNAKLNMEIAREIRAEYAPRVVTHRMLAKRYDVSESAIKGVLSGKLWPEPQRPKRQKKTASTSEDKRANDVTAGRPDARHHGEEWGAEGADMSVSSPTSLRRPVRPRRPCDREGCERLNRSRGVCEMHYQQWRRDYAYLRCAADGCLSHQHDGTRLTARKVFVQRPPGHRGNQAGPKVWLCREHQHLHLRPNQEIEQLNLNRLGVNACANASGCWIWTGKVDGDGYGLFDPEGANGLNWLAHMVAWGLLVGGYPSTLQLDHRCNEPACIAPFHLRPVTASANGKRRGKAVADPIEWKIRGLPAVQRFAWEHDLPGKLWS